MEFLSKSVEGTAQVARDFKASLKSNPDKATLVGLYGDLGSGKTTFMKYLAESLGVKETIQSPTFVIEKIYDLTPSPSPCEGEGRRNKTFDKLIHIDAYRIDKEEEMINLGWQEIIADPKNLICIEWPERIVGIMPEHIMLKFEHLSENERNIIYNNEKNNKEIPRVDKN
jgi:tRNA threonylcarbamoyladenosine biosynthesis protein TsaE